MDPGTNRSPPLRKVAKSVRSAAPRGVRDVPQAEVCCDHSIGILGFRLKGLHDALPGVGFVFIDEFSQGRFEFIAVEESVKVYNRRIRQNPCAESPDRATNGSERAAPGAQRGPAASSCENAASLQGGLGGESRSSPPHSVLVMYSQLRIPAISAPASACPGEPTHSLRTSSLRIRSTRNTRSPPRSRQWARMPRNCLPR